MKVIIAFAGRIRPSPLDLLVFSFPLLSLCENLLFSVWPFFKHKSEFIVPLPAFCLLAHSTGYEIRVCRVNWPHVSLMIVWTSNQSGCCSVLPPGSDGAEKGAGGSTKRNWAHLSKQEETGIQVGHERPRWVDDRADIFCFASRSLLMLEFPVTRCFLSPSRLDRLLHHLWDLHGQNGRAREGHVRLLQHPQRDYHDDGFLDHVVSVPLVHVRLRGRTWHASLFLLMLSSLTFWRYHTERSATVMNQAKNVYVRQAAGTSNSAGRRRLRGRDRKREKVCQWRT